MARELSDTLPKKFLNKFEYFGEFFFRNPFKVVRRRTKVGVETMDEREQFEQMVQKSYDQLALYVSCLFPTKVITEKFLKTVFLMSFWVKVHQMDPDTQKKYLYRLCDEFAKRLKQEKILDGILDILNRKMGD